MESHQFKTNDGSEWTISITIGLYAELKEKLGIDIGDVFNVKGGWLAELASGDNLNKMIDIITLCTDKERERREMSLVDFYEQCTGSVMEEAMVAFMEAIVNFTPAQKREPLRAIMETSARATEKINQKAISKLPALEKKLIKEAEELMKDSLQ